jgi:WD40 repeat protein
MIFEKIDAKIVNIQSNSFNLFSKSQKLASLGARLSDLHFVEGPVFSISCDPKNDVFVVGSGGGGANVGVRNYVTAISCKRNSSDDFYDFTKTSRIEIKGIPEVMRFHPPSELFVVGAKFDCLIFKLSESGQLVQQAEFKVDSLFNQGLGVCGDAQNLQIATAGEEGVIRIWNYQVGSSPASLRREIKPDSG